MVQCSGRRPICESPWDHIPINSCPAANSHTVRLVPQNAPLAISRFCSDLEPSCIPSAPFEVQQDCKASKGRILRQNFIHISGITRIVQVFACAKDSSIRPFIPQQHRAQDWPICKARKLYISPKPCVQQGYKLLSWNFLLGILEPKVSSLITSPRCFTAGQ